MAYDQLINLLLFLIYT